MKKGKWTVCVLIAGMVSIALAANGQLDPNNVMLDQNGSVPLEQKRIVLNFQDAGINEVLEYLSETAGMVIISDSFIDGRINLLSKQPLTIDETIALINSVLRTKSYAAVRTGRTLKIVPLSEASKLNIPVSRGSDPDMLVAGDDIITHIIPIRYASAVSLANDLSSLLPTYAVLTANESSNSLIITDTTAGIKHLMEIIKGVDTPVAGIADVRVFHLAYADADTTATLINSVFNVSRSGSGGRNTATNPLTQMLGFQQGGGGGRGGGRGGQQIGGGGGGGGAASNVSVVADADTRTNAVVVSGPTEVLDVISDVIKELDSNPDEERSLFIYTCMNAQSDNLMEVLNNLIQGLQQINRQNTTAGRGGTAGGGARNATAASSSSSNPNDFSDETYIESDPDTNSLLIMCSTKNYNKLLPIIKELDRPVPQVLIKCLLAELTTSNNVDYGTEFSVLNLGSEGLGGVLTDLVPDNIESPAVTTGSFMTKIVEGDLTWTLRALQQIGELNVLSRPYILTSNNQTATINVGQRVPFITDTQRTDEGGIINTIEYEDIGIILEVTPTINRQGLVIMDIAPEISTTTAETIPISEDLDAVVFANRSSSTRVAIRNGQTIVIGGLMQDDNKNTVNKVPILGDLPLLGELFKRTRIEKEKTELLIFLTPQVAEDTIELLKVSENVRENSDSLKNMEERPDLVKHLETLESVADTSATID